MSNNILGKNLYSNLINSYMRSPSSSKIKGEVLEINENKIKLGIGSEKALDITLNKPLDAKVGDTVVIDKKDITKTEITTSRDIVIEEKQFIENPQSKYDYILKSLDIPVKESSLEAVKTLDSHGVDITKENILSFMLAKDQLVSISEKLDYDTVIQLKDKNIDFEKESLQKVLKELEGVKTEKKSFSILRFLGLKKDMTTEDAEQIALKIYGSKMGKDVTDIIKALDKAGIEPTKTKIDEINNIFSKLHNIENIEDKTIIDSLKNKIETSIDNLYKLKNAVVRGSINVEDKLGKLVSNAYKAYSGAVASVTEGDLNKIEGDIKNRLKDLGIKATEELIKLSKDMISKGLDLTKENLEKIMAVKGAIAELNSNLDYEKTARLMASGTVVDKIDMIELANMIDLTESKVDEGINIGLKRLEILESIENIDLKTLAIHIKKNLPMTLESLNASVELLKNHDSEKDGLDIAVQTYLRANKEKLGPIIDEGYGKEMARALLQNEIPLNKTNMQEIYMLKKSLDKISDHLTSPVFEEIINEGINMKELNLNKLADKVVSFNENKLKEDVNTNNLLKNNINAAEITDKMKEMVDALKQITPERRDSIISLLMKNAIPLTLKEVQNLSFFLNNERQIGSELNEILKLIDKNRNEEIIQLGNDLKQNLLKINKDIKEGKQIGDRPYEEFSKILKELESKASFLSKEDKLSIQKSGEKLLDSLEMQLRLNREDTLLQLPLMMGEQFKNLQMYIMRDKKGSKKIDPRNMSVLLNFDTNHMGNVNIYVAVHYKNIVMKVGLGNKEDQNLIEGYSKDLEKYLKDLGYDLKDLSFRIHNDNNIMSMVEETEGNHRSMKKLLDVRI